MCPDEKVDSDPSCDVGEEENITVEGNEVEEGKGKVSRKSEIASISVKGKQNVVGSGKEMKDQLKPRMNYQVIQCDFCPMKYHKWSAFYVHRCTHTGETPVIPCGICEMEFPNIRGLSLTSHISWFVY